LTASLPEQGPHLRAALLEGDFALAVEKGDDGGAPSP
jgi:hypothetical protein